MPLRFTGRVGNSQDDGKLLEAFIGGAAPAECRMTP